MNTQGIKDPINNLTTKSCTNRALENATGNQVVITEVRVNVDPTTGQVDNSRYVTMSC